MFLPRCFEADFPLASASSGHVVHIWDVSSGECVLSLRGETPLVLSVRFGPHGRTLISEAAGHVLSIWDVHTGEWLRSEQRDPHSREQMCFAPDGHTIAAATNEKTSRIEDSLTGYCSHILLGHTSKIDSVCFSSDGRMVASGAEDATVRIWKGLFTNPQAAAVQGRGIRPQPVTQLCVLARPYCACRERMLYLRRLDPGLCFPL